MIPSKKLLASSLILSSVLLSPLSYAVDEASAESQAAQPVSGTQVPEVKVNNPDSVYEAQVGDTLYVSENASVWMRGCPKPTCGIVKTSHVGDKVRFEKVSQDGKYILVTDEETSSKVWMQAKDLQTTPCGKAEVDVLKGKIDELKNSLENYDSEIAANYRAAKAKIEKLEKENAALKSTLGAQTDKIEELDAERREFADKLETKDLDMQMRWWLQGAVIAFCGAIIGIICVYIPRPNSKKNRNRF